MSKLVKKTKHSQALVIFFARPNQKQLLNFRVFLQKNGILKCLQIREVKKRISKNNFLTFFNFDPKSLNASKNISESPKSKNVSKNNIKNILKNPKSKNVAKNISKDLKFLNVSIFFIIAPKFTSFGIENVFEEPDFKAYRKKYYQRPEIKERL